ncbi:putative HAD-superfamily hydrolase, subfamily IG, 5'-nucleotidase [Helianthus debilis subsp. tardiflorus]
MNFLIEARTINSSSSLSFNCSNILTYTKPSFFHDKNHANLFAVETESGKLVNTDNGTPLAQKLKLLRSERDWIVDQAHHLRHEDIDASEKEKLSAKLALLEIEKLKEIIKELVKEKEEDKERFNGIIGGLMAKMEKKKEEKEAMLVRMTKIEAMLTNSVRK